MTIEAVEKAFLQQLKEKLPKRRILCTPAGSEARALSIELFTREVKKQVGHSPSLNVRIDMAPTVRGRYGARGEPMIEIRGDYGEGISRKYKIGPGTYFNPKVVDTIVEYATRKTREALSQKEADNNRENTSKLVVTELSKFARHNSKGYPEWHYRGHGFSPKPYPDGRVRPSNHSDPLVWPNEIKAYLDLLLDFEEACAKLGRSK